MADYVLRHQTTGIISKLAKGRDAAPANPAGYEWRLLDGASSHVLGKQMDVAGDLSDPRISNLSPEVLTLRWEYRQTMPQLRVWDEELAVHGTAPPAVRDSGRARLYWGAQFTHAIAIDTARPIATRILVVRHMRYGALDITSTQGYLAASASLHVAPDSPEGWADPDTGDRVNLADSVAISASVDASKDLMSGAFDMEITG